jgi:hypothetical protein|tara:strand:+ start:122 stop:319 length:198 start_codon:yes stop_codon:yes gene_type:complete
MGKMNAIALDSKSIIENEWEIEQRALLLSQGYTAEEVDEMIYEMINEYHYEMAQDHGDWEQPNEN